jgi:hypothetical protein
MIVIPSFREKRGRMGHPTPVNSRPCFSVLVFKSGEVIAAEVPKRIRAIAASGHEELRADHPADVSE